MPRRTHWLRTAAATLAAAALLTPMAAASADESPSPSASPAPISAQPTTFTVGITQDVDSMNPFTGIVANAYEMYQLMYPTLTGYGADDFAAVPDLAESWEESADKETWTYKIRSGLTWSDGQPLTARDAAYSFNRVIEGDYEQTNYGGYVANITKARINRLMDRLPRSPTSGLFRRYASRGLAKDVSRRYICIDFRRQIKTGPCYAVNPGQDCADRLLRGGAGGRRVSGQRHAGRT